jgi:hypothetical protein
MEIANPVGMRTDNGSSVGVRHNLFVVRMIMYHLYYGDE